MKIERLSKENAKNLLQEWRSNEHEFEHVSEEYEEIRGKLRKQYEHAKECLCEQDNRDKYLVDVQMGASLYLYLSSQKWFSLRLASDDDFWRFLSVVVVPDVVADRWGENNETYFWKQSNRIWLKTIWWYIHLTWHNNVHDTIQMLQLPGFNSDIVQGLVERTGKNGTNVDLYRSIVLYYSKVQPNDLIKYKKRTFGNNDTFFRAVMKLNTAKCQVINPRLYSGGVDEYAQSLIKEISQTIKP